MLQENTVIKTMVWSILMQTAHCMTRTSVRWVVAIAAAAYYARNLLMFTKDYIRTNGAIKQTMLL